MNSPSIKLSLSLLVLASVFIAGCLGPVKDPPTIPATPVATEEPGAYKALKSAGYTEIEMTGYRILGCSEDDLFHDGFKAIGPTGVPVSGVVCSAVFKGYTIRLD
jgi:hypothetical protein